MSIREYMKTPGPSSRRQERTELTRARLIQSAEKIFARAGFEAAKLEEIASAAGYTRGAFYANFKDKEDLFLALLEGEISSRIERVRNEIDEFQEPAAKLEALRAFLLDVCLDRRWSLLALEFKLFAVRHPQVKARLAAMNRRFVSSRVSILHNVMESLDRDLPASANAVAMSLSALSNGLTLDHMLDRTVMPEDDVKKIMASFFDSMTHTKPRR
jgi:AcrR family transcriptional regulator